MIQLINHLYYNFIHKLQETPLSGPLMIQGFLDFPANGTHLLHELQVSGWAVSKEGEIRKVELFVDGRSYGAVPYGAIRRDVCRELPEISIVQCGYARVFELPEITQDTHRHVLVRISDDRGNYRNFSRRVVQKVYPDGSLSPPINDYSYWVKIFERLLEQEKETLTKKITAWHRTPVISVLLPVYNVSETWLRRCLDSVLKQLYPYWELCIADDASTAEHIRPLLAEYMGRDPRIKIIFREKNGHISECSNSALKLATGEYAALLDHDDELHEEALYRVAETINRSPDAMLIYSDEDKINEDGYRYHPYFKPDWNYDLFLSQNMISHLGVYQTDRLREIGGFRPGYEGSQDYDLALRFIEEIRPDQIHHIPRVLYHWRALSGSTALDPDQKDYAADAGLRAVNDHLSRTHQNVTAISGEGRGTMQQLKFHLSDPPPSVNIAILAKKWSKRLKRCLESILSDTDYDSYEVVIITPFESRPYWEKAIEKELPDPRRIKSIADKTALTYSRSNNIASKSTSAQCLCFLDDSVEIIDPLWLSELTSIAMSSGAGVIGAKIINDKDRVLHAGAILGSDGTILYSHAGTERAGIGYFGRASLLQSFSMVTGGCILVRRDLYEAAGGMNERYATREYADADLCLKLKESGYRTIWTPNAILRHHRPAGYKPHALRSDIELHRSRWAKVIARDPAYNPNLSEQDLSFSLAWPPRH